MRISYINGKRVYELKNDRVSTLTADVGGFITADFDSFSPLSLLGCEGITFRLDGEIPAGEWDAAAETHDGDTDSGVFALYLPKEKAFLRQSVTLRRGEDCVYIEATISGAHGKHKAGFVSPLPLSERLDANGLYCAEHTFEAEGYVLFVTSREPGEAEYDFDGRSRTFSICIGLRRIG